MKALSLVGESGSGKTTTAIRLIAALASHEMRVVAVKHTHHEQVDPAAPGKDSFLYGESEAVAAVLVTPHKLYLGGRDYDDPSLELVESLVPPCDLILVESWKELRLPCVQFVGDDGCVLEEDLQGETLAIIRTGMAVAGDQHVPIFDAGDIHGIADFIRSWVSSLTR